MVSAELDVHAARLPDRRDAVGGARRLLGGVAVLSLAAYVVTALTRIDYPYELQYFEGSTIEVSARVTNGLPLYGPPSTTFTPWPYPPLYFWITGELARVTGLSLPTLRFVSFLASLIALALIVLIVRRATGSFLAGLVATGLFAGTYRVSGAWFDAARVDSLLLMLLLAAIYAGLVVRTRRGGVVVGLLFLLAFLTKQNALIVAVPALGWLLWRRPRVGLPAAVTFLATAVASLVVGDLLTDGWYSPSIVSQLLSQGTVPRWFLEFWLVDLALPFALVLLALAWWVRHVRLDPRGAPRPWDAGDWAYLFAAILGLWLAGLAGRLHEGGYVNVAIPAHAGLALLIGIATAVFLRHRETTAPLLLGAAAVLALQVIVMSSWHLDVVPSAADRAAGDTLVQRLRTVPGPVLVPSHPYYLRLAGLPTHASAIAIGDALASRPGRMRDAVTAMLPWSLKGVNAVVLDAPSDANLFGPDLTHDFTLVTSRLVPGDAFIPPTDVSTKPSLLYVRTTELTP
jgi:hypothetical protein